MQTIGVLHHPKIPRTQEMALELSARLEKEGVHAWTYSAWDEDLIKPLLPTTELLITLGGDGSILRSARLGLDYGIPIAGVNFGRIGFLAEYQPDQAFTCLNDLVHGQYWIEERAVLHAELLRGAQGLGEYFALNDVVIGRGTVARVVRLRVVIDRMESIRHTADGIIVATPTGSTAYTVAAGGPIADPRVRAMIITPIAPHLSLLGSMLVPDNSAVEITIESDYPALISMDGQVEFSIMSNDSVRVTTSDKVSRFVRTRPKNYFYANLSQRLRL